MRRLLPVLLVTALLLLTASCAEVASMVVEDTLQAGLKSGQNNSSRTHTDNKREAKNIEKLKSEGKCPTCQGAGRTPDGRYTCETCKGTGKYESSNP